MDNKFNFLLAAIFLAESIYEVRLASFLQGVLHHPGAQKYYPAIRKVMRWERYWSWGSWLLLIALLLLPSHDSLPLIAITTLCETIIVQRMDKLKHLIVN